MTQPRYDVLCIGNAIVDVIADTDDAFLSGDVVGSDRAATTSRGRAAGPAAGVDGGRRVAVGVR